MQKPNGSYISVSTLRINHCICLYMDVSPQVQAAMDDWTAQLGGGPQRRDRPQGWRDGQDRYGNTTERQGFARPRGLAAEPYQVGGSGFRGLAFENRQVGLGKSCGMHTYCCVFWSVSHADLGVIETWA